ncbi:MAG: hypothetical protein PV362_07985 [Providencia heimbachae]|nr:hypothetical protein [Providencia heimbachae]
MTSKTSDKWLDVGKIRYNFSEGSKIKNIASECYLEDIIKAAKLYEQQSNECFIVGAQSSSIPRLIKGLMQDYVRMLLCGILHCHDSSYIDEWDEEDIAPGGLCELKYALEPERIEELINSINTFSPIKEYSPVFKK